jgi:hypothetical protein
MERAMRAAGLLLPRVWGTNVPHKWTPEAKKEVSRFVDDAVAKGKPEFPPEVHFTTRTLRYNGAPGIRVTRLGNHWERADVRTKVHPDKSLTIETHNVEQMQITFPAMAVDPRKVIVDGKKVFITGRNLDDTFTPLLDKERDGWAQLIGGVGTRNKRPGVQGPIDDAFMDRFLVVRPTGTSANTTAAAWMSSTLAKATNEWRAQFRGDARVKDDSQINDADIANYNLVLFGDPKSNRLLARIVDKLPMQWSEQAVRIGTKAFAAKTHVPMLIFPNPLNPERYVVLNSGFTFAAAGTGSNAQQTPKLPDYAVLDVEHGGIVVLADFFDDQWRVK